MVFPPWPVRPAGFEPAVVGLKGRCFASLSYGRARLRLYHCRPCYHHKRAPLAKA